MTLSKICTTTLDAEYKIYPKQLFSKEEELEADPDPQGHLPTSEDIFDCHN